MAKTEVRQANFLLPADLVEELKSLVPRREQSRMVAEALRKELQRLRLRRSLDESFGAWSKEPHPELENGVEQFVRESRRSSRGEEVQES